MGDVNILFKGAPDQRGEEDGPFFVDNTPGWSAFGDWVDSLKEPYPTLTDLAEKGACVDTAVLAIDLEDAMKSKPPSPAVAATIARLEELIGIGDENEMAIIGD